MCSSSVLSASAADGFFLLGEGLLEAERLRYEAGELTHRVTLGEVVEQALAALERERAQHEGGKA